MTHNDPQQIAIEVLGWLASEPELLSRFLALSGLEASNLRAAAGQPGFLVGVLSFLMTHEPTLIRFSEASGRPPEAVARAWRELGGGSDI
ncbi:DUF3572 family protein [Pseudohoeflea suaedae]|uniref:DUF3572 family protein n=2 Tax=Pseudohoeflea suaedae TaxID=877384 RepID=A0A4R5PSU2_9HYPH|nr:DUF3572 domain-containing protein [Pseudohoeflea suaedae]TDH39487.1 DUF3572 family protein [Pseudohoeflea suaedae]